MRNILLAALLILSSCARTTNPVAPTPSAYALLGTASAGNTTIELYSKSALEVGFNELFVKVITKSTNGIVKDAHVEVDCAMDMDTLHHRAPVEQCECHEPYVDDMWKIGAIFHRQGGKDAWTVRLNVHNHVIDEEVSVSIPVSVANSPNVVTLHGTIDEFILCCIPPATPTVGKNAISFMVYSTKDHIAYTSRDDVALSIVPYMPSMGHGSSGNTQPTPVGTGRYNATVNLIMKGAWVVKTTVTRADEPLGTFDFPITL